MTTADALKSGAIGAITLNVVHETARRFIPNSPRVDEPAMRAVQRFFLDPFGLKLSRKTLRGVTMAGDLLSNSLYYATVVGASRNRDSRAVWRRAWIYGLGAGVLTVVLPPLFRLGQQPTRNLPVTSVLTSAWYLFGSLAAAADFTRRSQAHSRTEEADA